MYNERYQKPKKTILREKTSILKHFGVKVTKDIEDRISEMYPNEIAIERYTRTLILDKLGN